MVVFVISKNGERLMPTSRLGKVRHMLKDGRAHIYSRNPFTIQLTYDSNSYTQPIEVCEDTGFQHIGISVKSALTEYVAAQYDLLSGEKKNHDDCRKYRRTRRNRKRYRAPRFQNRRATKKKGWFAPSIKNKADRHVDLIKSIVLVAPVTSVVIEIGQFDTQALKAVTEGKPIPEGKDYQHGARYGIATLREAVFQRDGYKCVFCGRSGIKDGAILHAHHVYFWRNQHGNSLDELATCCEICHISANHKEGGLLWGYDKKLPRYNGAAFMNTVRWYIYNRLKEELPVTDIRITYGAATKLSRSDLKLRKSHINDAYSMGEFHPEKRAKEEFYVKHRRNNRCLEKFYDAQFLDIRDGKKKSGSKLGCQRTKRREPRNSEKNLRIYHGEKIDNGKRSVRKQRYNIQPGDMLVVENRKMLSGGTHNKGKSVKTSKKSYGIKKVKLLFHVGSWIKKI